VVFLNDLVIQRQVWVYNISIGSIRKHNWIFLLQRGGAAWLKKMLLSINSQISVLLAFSWKRVAKHNLVKGAINSLWTLIQKIQSLEGEI
jgi:hypothetical protein